MSSTSRRCCRTFGTTPQRIPSGWRCSARVAVAGRLPAGRVMRGSARHRRVRTDRLPDRAARCDATFVGSVAAAVADPTNPQHLLTRSLVPRSGDPNTDGTLTITATGYTEMRRRMAATSALDAPSSFRHAGPSRHADTTSKVAYSQELRTRWRMPDARHRAPSSPTSNMPAGSLARYIARVDRPIADTITQRSRREPAGDEARAVAVVVGVLCLALCAPRRSRILAALGLETGRQLPAAARRIEDPDRIVDPADREKRPGRVRWTAGTSGRSTIASSTNVGAMVASPSASRTAQARLLAKAALRDRQATDQRISENSSSARCA